MPGRVNLQSPINWAAPLNRGLSAWLVNLPLRSGGTTLVDLARHRNGALSGGAAWSSLARPGGHGSIATVAGTSGLVSTDQLLTVAGATKVSWSLWVYRASTGDTPAAGFNTTGGINSGKRFNFIWFSDGNLYFAAENGSNAYGNFALGGTGWHHLTVVFDGSGATNADRLQVYVDGAAQSLSYVNTIATSLASDSGYFYLGRDGSERYGTGQYDDVRIFPGVSLTADQVLANYRASLAGYPCELNYIKRRTIVDFGGGVFTGTAAVTIGAATASGSASYLSSSTGSAAVSAAAATAAGSATYSSLSTGDAAVTVAAAIAAGDAEHSSDNTATAAVSVAPAEASGTATFTAPVYEGEAAVTIGAATCEGEASFSSEFTATAAVSSAPATASGSASYVSSSTGSAAVSVGAATAAGTATFTAPVYEGTAAVSVGPVTCSAAGTFAAPVYTGTAAVAIAAATASGAATFAAPVYTATAALTIAAATASGVATFFALGDVAKFPGSATFTRPITCGTFERPSTGGTFARRDGN